MKKTAYQVRLEGHIVGLRKSHREYTHAVVGVYTKRHTSEGWHDVTPYYEIHSFCGSLSLAQKALSSLQSLYAKHGAQNPHLPVDGRIVEVEKI